MEASTSVAAPDPARSRLDSEKALRIIDAMRASVAARGATGSTFDQVSREAGVSRGLLHYYFGTKERLLVAAVRRDCDLRMEALERSLSRARSADAIIDVLVKALEDFVQRDPDAFALVFELFTASRHNEELSDAMAELYRGVRDQIAASLETKASEGVLRLRAEPAAVGSVLLALGDGIALQMLSDPGWDGSQALATGIDTARFLLSG